ncbi:MAG: magnesium/cobalt transporter CorA [Pseudomonadota bacterium]
MNRHFTKALGIQRQSHKRGLSPGTLVHVGDRKIEHARLRLVDYDDTRITERELTTLDECLPFKNQPTVTWLNVDGLHDTDVVSRIGEVFGIHALVLEDIVNTAQRPKLEDFGDYLYVVCKMLHWDDGAKEVRSEQLSVLLGPGWVISFQEQVGDVFEPLRVRIREHRGRVRRAGPGYLAFALLDAVVDNYFEILERISEELEPLEERVMADPDAASVQVLHKWKREALHLRRAVAPLREVAAALARDEHPLIPPETTPFLRNVHDHTLQVADTVDGIREMLSSLLDLHLTMVSNRMNEVMKVLTVIATLFIPLTFVAGVYGMNFEGMPELGWGWTYPLGFWTLMAVVAGGLIWFFRRKRWF